MSLISTPDHILTCEEIEWMTQSLVYVRRRVRDGKALYIGAASCGLTRPLGPQHEKAKPEDGEVLEVYLTNKPFDLETEMITKEQPTLNIISHGGMKAFNQECQYCEKPFTSKHGKAFYCSPTCRFKAWDRRYPRQRSS